MNEVIGALLPLGLAVALSPFPIILIVLLLGSLRPAANGLAFLAGWVAGISAIVLVLTFAVDLYTESEPGETNTFVCILRILLGVILWVLATRKFIQRFGTSDAGPLPRWMASASSYSPKRSFGMGLTLSAANPKNLALTAAASVAIGAASISTAAEIWAALTYLLITSLTIAVPLAGFLLAPAKMANPLEALMGWLRTNHSILTGLLLLIFGFVLIGNGIASF